MKFKQMLVQVICFVLSAVILLLTVGCKDEKKTAKKKKQVTQQIVIVSDDDELPEDAEDTDSKSEDYDDTNDTGETTDYPNSSHERDLYKSESEERYVEKFSPEYEVKEAAWNGPAGYVIVYSDSRNYATAKNLQSYFKKQNGVTLEIKKDGAPDAAKEILVGDTKRYKTKLTEKQFAVSLNNGKLVFEGGHFAMVEKAADWFMTEKHGSGKVKLLSGTAKDFVSSVSGEYKYVWGDEFDGFGVDDFKWNTERELMAPTALLTVLFGEEAEKEGVIAVEDGRLKLRTIRYFNQLNSEAQYASGQISTTDRMGFMYGYAEIKARVPMFRGTWPSWWMTTAWAEPLWKLTSDPFNGGQPYTYNSVPYRLEFDIFEVFSSKTDIVPNFHKWWDTSNAGKYNIPDGAHTSYPSPINIYQYPEIDTRSNEYHIYGIKWTPTEITVSVDGKNYMTFDLVDGFNVLEDEYNEYLAQPLQMIFTNHIFVEDLQEMDPAGKTIENDTLPVEFFVDYIRIYQRDNEGGIWTEDVDKLAVD